MEKIKQFIESEKGKDVFTVLIVVLVGLSSFGLGRLSYNEPKTGLYVEEMQIPANTSSEASYNEYSAPKEPRENTLGEVKSATTVVRNFFASNRGQKYYPANCSAGKSIKQENRVYFATREAAEDAGYELSASCK